MRRGRDQQADGNMCSSSYLSNGTSATRNYRVRLRHGKREHGAGRDGARDRVSGLTPRRPAKPTRSRSGRERFLRGVSGAFCVPRPPPAPVTLPRFGRRRSGIHLARRALQVRSAHSTQSEFFVAAVPFQPSQNAYVDALVQEIVCGGCALPEREPRVLEPEFFR